MPDRIADIWGGRTPHAAGTPWPVRVDRYVDEGVAEADIDWVQSACVLCSNGCGMDIGVQDGRIVGVRGRASDRVAVLDASRTALPFFVAVLALSRPAPRRVAGRLPGDRVSLACAP